MGLHWDKISFDYVVTVDDSTYRVRRETEYIKPRYRSDDPIEVQYYTLQARKTKNIEYRNLGYDFYVGNPEIEDSDSVDNHQWNNMGKILERSEEILIAQKYINEPEEIAGDDDQDNDIYIPVEVYNVAKKAIIKSLKKKGIIPQELDDVKQHALDNILLRVLQHFRRHPFEILFDDSGKLDIIRLKEYEIMLLGEI